jgi:DNA-directed RNA polymerase
MLFIFSYGVTMFGARLQIKKQLKALGLPGENLVKFSTYIAQKTLGSLNESFESSM